jgi:hypothetical protein
MKLRIFQQMILTIFRKLLEGLECDKVEHLVFHNHTKIVLKIQNETQNIPGNMVLF